MSHSILDDVLRLAEKTGDRIIVVHPHQGSAFVILPFKEYEQMVGKGTGGEPVSAEGGDATPNRELIEEIQSDLGAWDGAGAQGPALGAADTSSEEERFYLEPSA